MTLYVFRHNVHFVLNMSTSPSIVIMLKFKKKPLRQPKYLLTAKKGKIKREKWIDPTQSYDKTPYTNRKFKKKVTTQKRHKNFDYTTIVDRLGTVSWRNDSHPTGVVKLLYRIPIFPITANAVYSKVHFQETKNAVTYICRECKQRVIVHAKLFDPSC